jgi:hypothetical protein
MYIFSEKMLHFTLSLGKMKKFQSDKTLANFFFLYIHMKNGSKFSVPTRSLVDLFLLFYESGRLVIARSSMFL